MERAAGTTAWSFWSLFRYSLEGIFAFSTAPLALASVLGLVSCVIAFLMMIWIIIKTALYGDPVAGFPTLACLLLLIMCAIFLLGGLQLFCIGVLGQYLSKTYLETKRRPIYIVRETEQIYRDKLTERQD